MSLTFFLGLFGLFSVWPLVFILNNAFKPLNEIFLFPPKLFVLSPTLTNFQDLLIIIGNSWIPMSRYLFNTLFLTAAGTAGTVIIGSMAAFPLAKYVFPGSKTMSKLIVYSLMFNGTVTALPNYVIMSKLNMIDSYWAVILPSVGSTLGLYLMLNFMVQVPDALIEAAKIDGASEFTIFWKVMMPLSKAAWITLIILSFQNFWGTTGGGFIFSEKLKPISYALAQIVNAGVARTGVASAVTLIMLVVPVAVFIFSQSNVIQTMASAGIKE
ncbi:carbohydrate ABC transporter permease [Paenibacillus pasadenensis]|uniref:Binding-protein-dependent transport systems inner membrane component n=2 Tax=Paenibacillus TaxID=44249 RepID=A0A2N5N8W1_9BACL|nr:carbohydrate ABC transporter permease [Paenibacillus pasadenensis]PLT46772.1 binding-protein-dependent transport systems inner membrane component [Paenibacillus pasadenensis]QGG58828.1 ABC transporter permease subunit [Paenibacillus sp. B01]